MNLATLPSDIIREIIKVGLGSIETVRLTVEVTSPPLRALTCLFWCYSDTYNKEKRLWDRIVRLLKRCSRIERLFLFPGSDESGSFDMIRLAMDEVVVGELVINHIPSLNKAIESKVLEILRDHPIKQLFLSTREHRIDLVRFLTEATRLVPVVKIPFTSQHIASWTHNHESYFGDLKNKLRKIPHFKSIVNIHPTSAYVEVVAVGNRFRKVGNRRVKAVAF